MSLSKQTRITRRQGLLGLFGGSLGLKAFVTGLPTWYLLNPRRATAQDLQCAINARDNLQYLILSVSSNGDPLNCNVPGTYEATSIIHPTQTEVEAVQVTLGGHSYGAALPWADDIGMMHVPLGTRPRETRNGPRGLMIPKGSKNQPRLRRRVTTWALRSAAGTATSPAAVGKRARRSSVTSYSRPLRTVV